MVSLDRYQGEEFLRALAGGMSPSHGNTFVFDKIAGWRFAEPAFLERSDDPENPIPVEDVALTGEDVDWSQIINTPTTLAGYGITDAYTKAASDARFAPISHTHHLIDLLDFGADGGYIRSNGSAWVRVSGVAAADLTGTTLPSSIVTSSLTTIGTLAGNLLFGSNAVISRNTVDNSDSGFLQIAGGGTSGITRGAYISLFGNEQANHGSIHIQAGNLSDSIVSLRTNAIERLSIATTIATFSVPVALGANDLTLTGSIASTGSRVSKGWFTDLQVTNAIVGAITGNAATATALLNARTIGGVSFDGTANITVASATGGFTVSGGTFIVSAQSATINSSVLDTSRLSVGFNGATHNGFALQETSGASGASFVNLFNSSTQFFGALRIVGTTRAVALNGFDYASIQHNGTESARFFDSGVAIASGKKIWVDGFLGTGDSFLTESSPDVFDLSVGGINPILRLSITALTFSKPAILKNYTVATLPTGVQGMRAFVTDALAPTYLATVVGGGAIVTCVFHNGTNWVAD